MSVLIVLAASTRLRGSLSTDVEATNPEFLLCVAFDEHNVPSEFLRIVPAYGRDFGYTLALMRDDCPTHRIWAGAADR